MVLVPGVGGDSSLFYIKTMGKAALENGYELVIVNYQGLGDIPLTVSKNFICITIYLSVLAFTMAPAPKTSKKSSSGSIAT